MGWPQLILARNAEQKGKTTPKKKIQAAALEWWTLFQKTISKNAAITTNNKNASRKNGIPAILSSVRKRNPEFISIKRNKVAWRITLISSIWMQTSRAEMVK